MNKILNRAVVVGALGYLVDIYDLLLFSIVRVASLKSLGVPEDQILDTGVFLLNVQMSGLLIGGILWGVLGDKRGRISVLFGSIFLYSIANILNGFVHSVEMYAVLRFLAGVGLAGELGAAITLVSEIMSKETRGYGTSIVAGVGVCGAVIAAIVGEVFDWRTAFIVGGVLGLCLLVLRINLYESKTFHAISEKQIPKGDFRLLFRNAAQVRKYFSCILVGIPLWFVIGILITLSPELGKAIEVTGPVIGGKSVMFAYMGLAIGDVLSGFMSQWMKSRKKAVFIFLTATVILTFYYVGCRGLTVFGFYTLCFALGLATGYWAVFVTIASEQFGTNIRATVTTTAPNFVRGALIPITLLFQTLRPSIGILHSALAVGVVCFALSYFSLASLQETYGKDLDYIEPHQ